MTPPRIPGTAEGSTQRATVRKRPGTEAEAAPRGRNRALP